MDPFTQRMLERAKTRREKLDNQKMIVGQRSPLQEKVNLTESTISNINASDRNNTKEKQFITATRKSKLQKLAQFYSSNNENIFFEDEELEEQKVQEQNNPREKSHCKLGRLNELASKIKQWEDDVHPSGVSVSGHNVKGILNPTKIIAVNSTVSTDSKIEGSKGTKTNEKQTIWDSSMVEKLCSQGFVRSESQAKLSYDFERKPEESKNVKKPKTDLSSKIETTMKEPLIKTTVPKVENSVGNRNEVLKKAAFFESSTKESPNKIAKDPAELSLAERKALFERNKGEVVLPKNPFYPAQRELGVKGKGIEKEKQGNEGVVFPLGEKQAEVKSLQEEQIKKSPCSRGLILATKDCSLEEESQPMKEYRNIPEPPPMPEPHEDAGLTSKSEEKVKEASIPRSGRLYPSLSSLDMTKECEADISQMDSFNESKNSNLCLNMTLSDLLELNKNNPATPPSDQSFSQSKECQVLNKMDRLLEDALNDLSSSGTEEDPEDLVPSPPKMTKSSSFEYKSGHGQANPLLHTVSFYRKQQQSSCLATESFEDAIDIDKPGERKEEEDESILVQNKIQSLIAEVNKQQTIISQASQALNLCLSTVEFSGSGEQVEGERLLLLASHKRQACLNEIQRLKVENTLMPQGKSPFLTERGDVNLSNIFIKLKRDALRSIAAAENLQYFVCLIKTDEQVLATPAVPATKENLKEMALHFPGQIKLENLLSNFKITVEVYNLELSKELLPHEVKYHIINKKEKKLLTPIKSKKSESRLVKPNIQSPAGPNAVRTSNFQMCGYIVFSLREINRTQWILNKVPYVSPVEGTISMTITSQLRLNDEFRGFLTMFDDISGFGAWHRRWCLLSSHFISYWKYPDDETKKVPIGTIDLRSVITENVGLVSRDICARLNTFLLETTRPRLSEDVNSLVVSVKDDVTTIRHLLSADSKLEMSTWCKKLNTALALLRSWKCNLSD